MPTYTIQDSRTGRQLKVRGEQRPSPEQMSQLFALQDEKDRAALESADLGMLPSRPEPVSTVTGFTPSQAQARAEYGGAELASSATDVAVPLVRYGAPLAVGVATGGVGLIPAALTAAASGVSETAAQLLEQGTGRREELSFTDIGASTIAGGAPVFQSAKAPAASFIKTLLGQVGTGEASRFVQNKGEFKAPEGTLWEQGKEALFRWGLPIGVATAAKYGSELERAKINLAEVAAQGRRPLVMDANPRLAPLEAAVFQRQGLVARQYADEMNASLGDIINNAYGSLSLQSQAAIADELAPYVGKYDELRSAADAARRDADQANEALKVAAATRSKDLAGLRAAAEVAENNRLLAENNFEAMKNDIFGRRTPVMTSEASLGALEQRMRATAKTAESGLEASFDALYANAGLTPNDVVVSKDAVLRSISARTAPGRAFEGDLSSDEARRAVALFFGDKETATLEELRNFKRIIADKLPQGSPSDLAGRYASSLYDALKKSSGRYLKENYPEEVAKAFSSAQNLAAANFATRQTSAIDFLKEGKFTEFYSALKEKGKLGQIALELDAYAKSLARTTGAAIRSGQVGKAADMDAINAAQQFKNDVNTIILNGIVGESIVGRSGGMNRVVDVIDPKKLMENLGYFESQGFSLGQLGVRGTDVKKLIKANAMVGKEPLTVAKLNEFLSLLPTSGGDLAAARVAYRQAVANAMIESGAKERAAAFKKASDIAKKAGISAADAEQAFNSAAAEPLTQFFKEAGSMMINKGSLQNSNWIDTIITKEPEIITRFVESIRKQSLTDPTKAATLDKLREAAITYAVKRFLPDITGANRRVDAEALLSPFISNARESQMFRQNLRAMMGDAAYNHMLKTVIDPTRKIMVNRAALGEPIYNYAADLKAAISAEAIATGRTSRGTLLAGAIVNTATAAQEKYYNVISRIWLNPKYAAELAKVGYNINRFAQLNARNAMAVELAMREDEKEQQEALQQQYLKPQTPR